jgi:cell wall-associated NlpC family hydrolase
MAEAFARRARTLRFAPLPASLLRLVAVIACAAGLSLALAPTAAAQLPGLAAPQPGVAPQQPPSPAGLRPAAYSQLPIPSASRPAVASQQPPGPGGLQPALPAASQPALSADPTAWPSDPPPIEVAGTAASQPADEELAAPGEQPLGQAAAGAPAADSRALGSAAAPPGARTAGESGDFGVEYQLSREAAASWLDRVGSWFKGVAHEALAWLGTPYRRGGASRHGIDCSGLTGAVFARRGIDLPRTAAEQFTQGLSVGPDEMRPGDLVFFRNTYKRGISHVGIYVGEGRFVHAAGRRQGVIVSDLARPYYQLRYAGARRVATPPGDSLASLSAAAGTSPTVDAAGNAGGAPAAAGSAAAGDR